MEKETYSFDDFVASLKSHFAAYAGTDSDNNTYTEGYFNNFLKSMAGVSDDEEKTETNDEAENENTPRIRDLNIAVQPDPIVCTLFTHNVTKSELLIMNTLLNVTMCIIAVVTFIRLKRA